MQKGYETARPVYNSTRFRLAADYGCGPGKKLAGGVGRREDNVTRANGFNLSTIACDFKFKSRNGGSEHKLCAVSKVYETHSMQRLSGRGHDEKEEMNQAMGVTGGNELDELMEMLHRAGEVSMQQLLQIRQKLLLHSGQDKS